MTAEEAAILADMERTIERAIVEARRRLVAIGSNAGGDLPRSRRQIENRFRTFVRLTAQEHRSPDR